MTLRSRFALPGVFAAIALSVSALTGCGNGGASEPAVTSYDPAATSKLQFAVGVATLSSNGAKSVSYGLNVIETLRQKDGLSGVLYNVPMIVGPTTLSIFLSTETGQEVQAAGNDLGTNHITWGTLNQTQWTGPPREQKEPTSGAFGYGLCPCNSDGGPENGVSPLYQSYNMPVYGDDEELWYGGPPAFPEAGPSLVLIGWQGYSLGFTDFAVTPVRGTYHLYAAVPPAYDTPQNPTPSPAPGSTPTAPPGILAAGAQLHSLDALPAFATPSLRPDNKGGGTIAVDVPPKTTEAMVEVWAVHGGNGICGQDHNLDAFYTIVTHRIGPQSLALPDNIGPYTQSGKKTPSLCSGEEYLLYAVGTDFPAYESSYPNDLSQLPHITGKNGQADITTSDKARGTYP